MTSRTQEVLLRLLVVVVAAALYAVHHFWGVPELNTLSGLLVGWVFLPRPGDSAPVPRPPPRRERITILPKE